jgi:hypothetical protein
MTRLADALQRANRSTDAAGTPPPPAPTLTPAPIPTGDEARVVRSRVQIPPSMPPTEAASAVVGTPLIGPPSKTPSEWRKNPELVGKLVGTEDFPNAALEQYRKLAATLHRVQDEHNLQVVMTASCLPGEGKSLTAINLALTLSGSYERRVLLIDADLRRPTVQRVFQLPTITGLDDGLKAEHDRPMPITCGPAGSGSVERVDVRSDDAARATGARGVRLGAD